ncbi:MAG: tetratricopeptide repeat protein [Synechococcales cyanobacterium RM1_1_8]|nr:tetratricopeptide repeat protein [Synechococcales cyanobacterium RM1_1_8]
MLTRLKSLLVVLGLGLCCLGLGGLSGLVLPPAQAVWAASGAASGVTSGAAAVGGTTGAQSATDDPADAEGELQALYRDLDDLYQRAFIATDQGDFVTAEALWDQAIERMPSNPATWSNRGNARVSQFKLEAAIADFDQAIALAPNQPGPYINRGTAWEGLQQWERAIADYNQGLTLDPEDFIAFNNRGNAEGGKGDWEAARDDFYHAAELARGVALPNINYALTLYQLGEKTEGTRKIRNLVRRYSQAADPRAALTAVLWDQGLTGEAESNWAAAVNLDRRYKDINWVRNIRRWPPRLADALERFLTLESTPTPPGSND